MCSQAGFESIINFRDVADVVNKTEGPRLKHGQLFRSARPDLATIADRETLRSTYKIRTIIDLRSKTEHIEAAKKFEIRRTQVQELPSSNSNIAAAIQIPEIKYAEINLNGKGFERHLVWQLGWWDLASVATNMILGYRLNAISIIGRNVLQPRGLTGLGKDTLEHSGPEIKEFFQVLADPSSYPVLIHCTQGKDRTGLTVLLVLLLCTVNQRAIEIDYIQTEAELESEFEDRMKEIRSIGLDETFAKCPETFVSEIVAFIDERYGGIDSYLTGIGVDERMSSSVRQSLLEKTA